MGLGQSCDNNILDLCNNDAVTDKTSCETNLSNALDLGLKLNLPENQIAPIIEQCAPCMIDSLGGATGAACISRNQLSPYQRSLFTGNEVKTCRDLIQMLTPSTSSVPTPGIAAATAAATAAIAAKDAAATSAADQAAAAKAAADVANAAAAKAAAAKAAAATGAATGAAATGAGTVAPTAAASTGAAGTGAGTGAAGTGAGTVAAATGAAATPTSLIQLSYPTFIH